MFYPYLQAEARVGREDQVLHIKILVYLSRFLKFIINCHLCRYANFQPTIRQNITDLDIKCQSWISLANYILLLWQSKIVCPYNAVMSTRYFILFQVKVNIYFKPIPIPDHKQLTKNISYSLAAFPLKWQKYRYLNLWTITKNRYHNINRNEISLGKSIFLLLELRSERNFEIKALHESNRC